MHPESIWYYKLILLIRLIGDVMTETNEEKTKRVYKEALSEYFMKKAVYTAGGFIVVGGLFLVTIGGNWVSGQPITIERIEVLRMARKN